MARKDELKKQRRKHRLEKKRKRQESRVNVGGILTTLREYAALGDPATFPGACDETLARPDLIKAELMEFAIDRNPGEVKFERLLSGLSAGLLNGLPDIDHWAMEEFAWHGLPGDSWHPVDEYLQSPNLPLSPAARSQISLWKQARIGLFEIGTIVDDTVWLREWDVLQQRSIGDHFRAITLNLSGVHVHSASRGKLLLTHVSPWEPDRDIKCGMGYGVVVPKEDGLWLHEYLGLRKLELVSQPLPWNVSREAVRTWLREWRGREWHGWFAERIVFPFQALVPTPPKGAPRLMTVRGMVPSTPQEAATMGVYFHGEFALRDAMTIGGTGVNPVDIASPNRLAFAEYQAFRAIVGPPIGTVGKPSFVEFAPGKR